MTLYAEQLSVFYSDLVDYVGPVGILLLLLSIFSIMLILLKILAMASFRLGQAEQLEQDIMTFNPENIGTFTEAVRAKSHPAAILMLTASQLLNDNKSYNIISSTVQSAALALFARLSRYNRLLELIGLIAPLLGLLGTILGMITAFQALQESGQQADPTVLAGGIWEALLTTALGLIVAIPAIVAFNLIENRMEALREQTIALVGQFLARIEEVG